MSDNDRPELRAYQELETVVRHLGEELAAFRKRALVAESRLKDAGPATKGAARGPLIRRLASSSWPTTHLA